MILGPSYSIATRKAAVQRCINWMPVRIEAGNEKSGVYLRQCPGMVVHASFGGPVRGQWVAQNRHFVVAGSTLYEVSSAGNPTPLGTLLTSTGVVDMAEGLIQLVIVDGPNGYVFNLSSGVFSRITADGWHGANRVGYLDGYFLFNRPDTQQFYISEIDDATTLDALDFASAEAAPDNLTSLLVDHRDVVLFGGLTTEPWNNVGAADFPFQRNAGAILEVGCVATHSARKVDTTFMWLGQDRNGSGVVWRAEGYRAVRASTHAVEEALQASTDLSRAVAFAYQQDGQTFYAINAPGVSTTWVYDASIAQWHERADVVDGEPAPWRATSHAYAHGYNIVGSDDGKLYRLDFGAYTYGSDEIYRERTSPHSTTPSRSRIFFSRLRLDVEVGETGQDVAPLIEMRASDDGGYTWGAWRQRSLGAIGEYSTPVVWDRCGSARDRVWQIKTTDNCRASIVGAAIDAQEGNA